VGIRATPIAEAFLALVLVDHAMRQRAQNADIESPMNAISAARVKAGKGQSRMLEDPDPLEA
jgi:chorismate synthase